MFNKYVVLFLVLSTALFFWIEKTPEPSPSPVADSSMLVEKDVELEKPVEASNDNLVPQQKQEAAIKTEEVEVRSHKDVRRGPWAELPSPDHVRVEVIDGYAIGFGDVVLGKTDSRVKVRYGAALSREVRKWPSKEIPYVIDKKVKNTDAILKAIEQLNQKTVIKMIPYKGQSDGIIFVPFKEHCASFLGYIGGLQPIMLNEKCDVPQILHEIMHALGFVHEQSRWDRDRFLNVLYENIDPKFINQFDMAPYVYTRDYTGRAFDFDYQSILLYPPTAFSKASGLKTLEFFSRAKVPDQKTGLSQGDIDRVEYWYGRL